MMSSLFLNQLRKCNVTVFILLVNQLKVSTITIQKNVMIDSEFELFCYLFI